MHLWLIGKIDSQNQPGKICHDWSEMIQGGPKIEIASLRSRRSQLEIDW